MANSNKHGKQTIAQGIHGAIAYEYADAPARLSATGFQPEDIYKIAIQLDDKSVWILYSISPVLWAAVGSNPSLVQGISAGTTQAPGPTVVFSNVNGVSFGASGHTVTASVQPSGLGGIIAGTETATSGTLSFSNGNGITFGINGSVLTASILPGAAAGIGAVQGGTQTQTSGTLAFVNSNGISFGMSNSSQITASYTVPSTAGLLSNINVSGGTTSNNLSALVFGNGNNVSFGLNGSTITASVAPPSIASVNFSAGTTSNNLSNLIFSNSNGLSFGLNGSTITGSYTVPAQTVQTQSIIQAVYDGANSITTGTIRFSNANGISFGVNGQTLTASHNAITSQTNQSIGLYALGNTTQNFSTTLDARSLSFNGLGNITVGYSNGSIQISGVGGVQSNQTEGFYALGNTIGQSSSSTFDARTISISGVGDISVGYSGNALVISGQQTAQTQSNVQGISAGTQIGRTGDVVFSNSNGISFGMSNSSVVTASYTVPNVPAQTNQTVGLYALGNTTQNSSTTLDARTLSFNGLGAATVGYSNGSIQLSVPVQSAQTQNVVVPSAGTQTATSGTVVFSNSNGISFGMSNSSVVTASYTVPSTAGLISNINVSAGTTSNNLNAITFSNLNGISFGLNASTITASYTVPNVPVQTNQTIGLYALGNTTQNSSTTLDARTLSFNGLGAATVGYSNGSIQISVPTQTAQTQSLIQAVYDGVNSISTGTIRFTNANGVSFSVNGQTISGSVAAQTNQTLGLYALGNTFGQSSSSTFDARTLSFNGSGIASVGYSNGSVVVNVPAAGASINVSAGTTSNNLNAITFSNANNVTFGLNGSVLTASVVPPSGAVINISAGTTSNNVTALTFSNSNGLAFGLNGSTITGSYTVPTQTAQTVGLYALGNTTQNSSTTLDARTLSFNGLGAATVGYSNGSIQISVPTQTAQTQSLIQAVYDGVNSITTGTIRFSNANGISFGVNGQTITASVNAGGNLNISAGTTSNNLTAVTFSNANNVTFGLNASTVTASASFPAQTNQTIGLYALGNTTQNSSTTLDARTLSFNGLGIITAGYSNGSIQLSATQSAQTQNIVVPSAGTQTATSGTVIFSNSNGISFGMSNSSVITASYTVPSTVGLISAINVSAGTTSNNLSAITFSNSNGISFGLNASTITASYTVPTQTNQTIGLYALGNTTQNSSTTLDARTLSFNGLGAATVGYSNGSIQISVATQTAQTQSLIQALYDGAASITTGTVRFSNSNGISFGINGQTVTASHNGITSQTNQTIGLYALGNTTQNSSTTLDARTLSFNGLGAATVGYSNGSVQISVSTQTNQTVGLYAIGNTTQNSSTTLDARTLSFNGAGIASVGYSNGSVIISAPSFKASHFMYPNPAWMTNFTINDQMISLQHVFIPNNITASQMNLLMALSGNTNSTGALSISLGLFTMSGSTMSLASSNSQQITWTSGSQTTNSSVFGGISGTRYRTVSLNNWNITPGDYILGMWFRTTNDGTWKAFGQQGPTIVGAVDGNETNHYLNGYSISTFSSAMMNSINVTNTNYVRTGDNALQHPGFILLGSY